MSNAHSPQPQDFTVHLPSAKQVLEQDAEWCILERGGERRRLRFHDYHEIFAIPGLYERLFYDELKCDSPAVVRDHLARAIEARGDDPGTLTILDVGAGNGMVGEELSKLGIGSLVGVDILPEAAAAATRDRPGVYDDYQVVDLTNVPEATDQYLRSVGFNTLASVAALGFGDMPPQAFAQAYNYVTPGGLITFTIKEDFVSDRDPTGFNLLIQRMLDGGIVTQTVPEHRYRHRFAASGTPLYYLVFVVEKVADVPPEWLTDIAE